jgi:hypothetical protein
MNGKETLAVTNGMKTVALLLMIGGVLGDVLTIWLDVNLLMNSQRGMLSSATAIAGVFILIFGWCVWTGVDLWRGRRQALKFAMILFAMQIPVILLPGFSYYLHTGLMVQVAIVAGGQFSAGFQFGSAFNFYISPEVYGLTIGVNLVALLVLIYLIRVWRELADETRAAAAAAGRIL